MCSFEMLRNYLVSFTLFIAASVNAQNNPYDCFTSRVLTSKTTVVVKGNEIGGIGVSDERGDCYQSELAPYWFSFTVCKTGTLQAYIDPEGTANFDFVLYDVTDGCTSRNQLVCNNAVSNGANNNTGIGCNNGPSCTGEISLVKGRTYALMFNRITNQPQSGFSLILGGTCTFENPAEALHQPKITAQTTVCGLTTTLSATVNGGANGNWQAAAGPGSVTFTQQTEPSTSVTVGNPGTYKFFFNDIKNECGVPVTRTDSIEVTFRAQLEPVAVSADTVCESSEGINLNTWLAANVPTGGSWTSSPGTGITDNSGIFYPNDLGGTTYTFTYAIPASQLCFRTPASIAVTVSKELKVVTDSARCFNSGTSFRVFTHIFGGIAGTYTVNGSPVSSAYYSSPLLPNNFQYSYEISDKSGCAAVTISGKKDCNCTSDAGSLAPEALMNCSTQTITVTPSSVNVGAGDVRKFILYSNPADPKGSILVTSGAPSITFQSPLVANTDYYIASAVGNSDGNGELDLTDPCLSISNGIRVRFAGPSAVTVSADTTICEGQQAFLHLAVPGGTPVKITLSSLVEDVVAFVQPGESTVSVRPTVSGEYVISAARDVLGCPVQFFGTAKIQLTPRPSLNYRLISDSVVCGGQSMSAPKLLFTIGVPDTLTVYYRVNGIDQPVLTNVTSNSTTDLLRVSNGKNSFQVYRIVSGNTGCTYDFTYPVVNYYYLDSPVITLKANKTEFCDNLGVTQVTFEYAENIKATLYYNISGVRVTQTLADTLTRSYNVTQPLVFNLDSVVYPDFKVCTFPVTGRLTINQYTRPNITFQTSPITCTEPQGKVIIHSSNRTALYDVDNFGYSSDTIYTFDTPGIKPVVAKLGESCTYNYSFTINKIDPYKLTLNITDTRCAKENGSIVPVITGISTPPVTYTYNDLPKNTNLAPGTYVVKATDGAGCVITSTGVVDNSEPFVVTAVARDTAKCISGVKGSIVVTASGGDGTIFTYSSDGMTYGTSPTLNNLDPRFYTVYAKNNKGCIDSVKLKVISDSLLRLNVTVDKYITCYESNDGVVRITPANSTADMVYSSNGYNYSANNSLSNLSPGQQVLYARETTGCKRETTTSFELTRPEPIQISLISEGNPACFNINNGFFILRANGGSLINYSYTVNNGANFQNNGAFSGLAGGTYTIFAKNSVGCSSDTITTTLIAPPPIFVDSVNMTLNPDGTTGNLVIHGSGGFAPLTYSVNGTTYFSDSTFLNLPKGTYTVYVKDDKGCIETKSVLVGGVGIDDVLLNSISVYPNPFASELTISRGETLIREVKITNALGQEISIASSVNGEDLILNTADWKAGIYIIQVVTTHGTVTKKVLKL